MSTVSVIPCESYEYKKVRAAVDQVFKDAGGIERFIHEGTRVLIKPNLVARRSPELSVTTHPVLVEAVARAAIEKGAIVTIADSPGGSYNKSILKKLYDVCGMSDVAESSGAILNEDVSDREVPLGGEIKRLRMHLIAPLFENDVIINLPKLKTHTMTYLSGCIKNLFGMVAGVYKTQFHYQFNDKNEFSNMLVDLCEFVKPTISIVDAIDAMEGNGPSNGKICHMGLILGGDNPHAVDFAISCIIGIDSSDVLTLRNAQRRGLVSDSFDAIEIKGSNINSLILSDFEKPDTYSIDFGKYFPPFIVKTLKKVLMPAIPKFDKQKCISCNTCIKACPAEALTMINKRPNLQKNKCIRCYCCQEMCPKDAIILQKKIFKIVNKLKVGM